MFTRRVVRLSLVTLALLALGCSSTPGSGRNGELRSDSGVEHHEDQIGDPCDSTFCACDEHCVIIPGVLDRAVCVANETSEGDTCDDVACDAGEHCELLATPCAPDSPSCEPVPVCVPDVTADCTDEECGPLPPTLPCADGSAVPQVCTRHSAGACSWVQPACPQIGDPCTGCEPCPIPEFSECRWTEIGVCSEASDSCV